MSKELIMGLEALVSSLKKEDLPLEIKESSHADDGDLYQSVVGEWVLVRDRNEGVNFGQVLMIDRSGVKLGNARRLWYHSPKKGAWYEGVSKSGLGEDSKISEKVDWKLIVSENYSLTIVSPSVINELKSAKAFKEE